MSRDQEAVNEAHRITVTHVKTRNQWEGKCACGGFTAIAPGKTTAGEANVRSNMRLHQKRNGVTL